MRARRWIASCLLLLSASGCLTVLGDFDVESLPPGVVKCEEDKDCGNDGVCYSGTCSKACGTGNPCPGNLECGSGSCPFPVGTPCKSNRCGSSAGICIDKDPGGRQVDPYCSVGCGNSGDAPCPSGYGCISGQCYKAP